MKFAGFLVALALFLPCTSFGAASSSFQDAAKLLSAARRGDTRTVQYLINAGVDVNYIDSTGLSLVCTAVMNNDTRAIQVLQMYGADASNCDRQIKEYKQKAKRAANGEEYGFFSGLSSSHVLVLSAIGVAGIIGGVMLLTDALDSDNENPVYSSGGSHIGGGSGGSGSSSSGTKWFSVPYGPAYLVNGVVNPDFDLSSSLSAWDTGAYASYFNYLQNDSENNYLTDGLNQRLQNYLLMMGGYYAFASGYMGQRIFRNSSNAPVASASGKQGAPIRVALVTGNGINPVGSAGFGTRPIRYAESELTLMEDTDIASKYLNSTVVKTGSGEDVSYSYTEQNGFDLSGSGSVFNPFVDVNQTALAKIVGGWEAGGSSQDDLYGFVPNGQLVIYRTGNGQVWNVIENATSQSPIGQFCDVDTSGDLSLNDTITIGETEYTILSALAEASVTNPTVTVNGTTYDLSGTSSMFIAKCPEEATDCTDFVIYVGTDGAWYVNTTGGNDIDAVYTFDETNVYDYKTKTDGVYTNFTALRSAYGIADVIANTNVLSVSRDNNYTTIGTLSKEFTFNPNGALNLLTFYQSKIDSIYGTGQGGDAHNLFNMYASSSSDIKKTILIMPAGEYLFREPDGTYHLFTPDATFENYAPMLYGSNLNHNFMTVVAVSHNIGTSSANTIGGYGNGTGASYGKLSLSVWSDSENNIYQSRRCGMAGVGSGSIDPWCFAAAGPTAEMAAASAAGAVASLKAAFNYMTNSQIFTLLALTADGPYLNAYTDPQTTNVTVFTPQTLAGYLDSMYEIPGEYDVESLLDAGEYEAYLNLFKEIYGYGLINLERAIRPGHSIFYFSNGKIVSASGNSYWRSGSLPRASNVLSLSGRGAITTSFYDVVQSLDGTVSLPRVWNDTVALDTSSKHGLYMGDLLGEFDVGTRNKQSQKIGNFEFSMAMSPRAYSDNMNGLDNLRVAFINEDFDVVAEYQRHLTDDESRFDGRANGLLALASNAVSSKTAYKLGNFSFGVRAFNGAVTDESLLENDPVVSSQYEPGRLGFADGGALDANYKNDKFAFDLSVGVMHETDTVLGMYSDGLLYMNGAKTQYVDAVATYKVSENVKLLARGTFAKTDIDEFGGLISSASDIKSNAFAFGLDIGGFGLTVAAPLAVVDGNIGYGYAEYEVIENGDTYELAVNNVHTEYVDLSAKNRELRFTTSYKKSFGEFTDAGVELMYRLNPNNTNVFGNESVFMLKIQRKIGL